jgi:mannose-1-phosphate guanylyltransferase/mannose-6-phosphate isomerase
VETRDAVLIAPSERDQDVRRVVEELSARKHPSVELHQTVHRPWGSYTVLVDSRDCHVLADSRTVAIVGLHGVTVVETRDAVLIAPSERDQDVKRVVEALSERKHPSVELHQTVHRPWGSYTVLEDADDCKVKRLVVKPGEVLSLQKHARRAEHWTVVQGTAKVRVGDNEFLLRTGETTHIPVDTLHRLENPGTEDIALIEVQTGDYFGEDDIVRLEDRYGRVLG